MLSGQSFTQHIILHYLQTKFKFTIEKKMMEDMGRVLPILIEATPFLT